MKLLVFSDLHAHNFKQFSKQHNGVNSRLQDILLVLDQIVALGRIYDVAAFLFAGDMFHAHTNVEHDVYNLTREKFCAMQEVAPVFAIAGQHDLQIKKGYGLEHISFNSFTDMPNFTLLHGAVHDLGDGLTIYGHSWVHPALFESLPLQKADIGMFHEPVFGADVGGGYFIENGVKVANQTLYKLAIFGDIHKSAYANGVLIPGAPLQHSFKDEGQQRGCWIIDTSTLYKAPKFVPLQYTPFVTAKVRPDYTCYFRKTLNKSKAKQIKKRNTVISKDLAVGRIESYVAAAKADAAYVDIGYKLLKNVDSTTLGLAPLAVKKVRLNNFMTFYGEHEFIFEDGITVIYGQVDTFDSNGAGKSNLFDAISWCQYGKISKEVNAPEVINWDAGKDCWVSVEYEDGTVFTRYAQHPTYHSSFMINGTHYSSLKEAKSVLLPMVGSVALFQNINYFSQENADIFTHMGDAARKQFLSDLLGFDAYIKAGKAARKQVSEFETASNKIQAKLEVYDNEYKTTTNELELAKDLVKKFKAEQLQEVSTLMQRLESNQEDLKRLDSQKLVAKAEALEQQISTINTDFDRQALDMNVKKMAELKTKTEMVSQQITELQAKASDAASLDNTQCPICLRVVDSGVVATIQKFYSHSVRTKQKELNSLQSQLDSTTALHKTLVEARAAADARTHERAVLQTALTKLRTKIHDVDTERQRLHTKISNIEIKIEEVQKRTNPYLDRLSRLQRAASDYETKISNLKLKIDVIDEEKAMYSFWSTAFSTKTGSLISYILDECVTLFNEEANAISQAVFQNTMKIELRTAVHLKSNSDIVDKLRFVVFKDSVERSYGSLSGGEKRRVDLTVFLAFGRVAMALFGLDEYPFGITILDEAISALDEVGKDSVIEMFQMYGAKKLYLVSHEQYSLSAADHEVFIHKVDGKSSIIAMESA